MKGLASLLAAAVITTMLPGTFLTARADENKKSTLDISKESIVIGASSISGKDSEGSEVNQVNSDGYIITGTSATNTITVTGGSQDVTLSSVNIESNGGPAFSISGGATVNLKLNGTNILTGGNDCAGLEVPENAALTIDSLSGVFDADTLSATSTGDGAGIGGNSSAKCGSITINGGSVTATSQGDGAGIGDGSDSSYVANYGTITINGGLVTALSKGNGAGVGDGNNGNGVCITIKGGSIDAESCAGSGIGEGNYCPDSNFSITIFGGTVVAKGNTGDSGNGVGIGSDESGESDSILIAGGSVNTSDNYVQFNPAPTNGTAALELYTATLPQAATVTALAVTQDNTPIPFGGNGMKTDGQNNLYLYLPEYSGVTQAMIITDDNHVYIRCFPPFGIPKIPDQTYTGNEIKPSVAVTNNGTGALLTEGADYKLAYYDDLPKDSENYDDYTNGGDHRFEVVGLGQFAGETQDVHFNITSPVTITGISPGSGPDYGGAEVTIKGSHFTGTTDVYFGYHPCNHFTVVDDSTIVADSPKCVGADDAVDISIYTPAGDCTAESAFKYLSTVQSLTITGDKSTIVKDDSEQLKAAVILGNNTTEDVTYLAKWNSGDSSVVSVDDSGNITAIGPGTATITATFEGKSGTFPVTVQDYHTITIEGITNPGSVMINGMKCNFVPYKVADGATAVLTAVPKEGDTLDGWYDDAGNLISRSPTLAVTPAGDVTYSVVFKQIPSATLTVKTSGNGSVRIDGGTGASQATEQVTIGKSVTLTATPDNGNQFLYWEDSNGRVLSNAAAYSLTVGTDTSVTAVFAANAPTKHLVTFINGVTNETIESIYVDTSASTVDKPSDPYLYGYTFTGWDKDTAVIQSTTDDVIVKAQFSKNSTTYGLIVNNGTQSGSGSYSPKDFVTVTANAADAGKKFSCWEDGNGNIISYSPTYSFYITANTSLTAEYADDAGTVIQTASIAITSVSKDAAGGKITFVAERTVPDGCTVLSHGIILTSDSTLTADTFVIGAGNVLKATAKTTGLTGTYIITKGNVSFGSTWYARGYVVYQDANGNIVTKYSSIVSETM